MSGLVKHGIHGRPRRTATQEAFFGNQPPGQSKGRFIFRFYQHINQGTIKDCGDEVISDAFDLVGIYFVFFLGENGADRVSANNDTLGIVFLRDGGPRR